MTFGTSLSERASSMNAKSGLFENPAGRNDKSVAHSTRNAKPKTLNLKPYTLDSKTVRGPGVATMFSGLPLQ